jgi:hypothetical protein
MSIDLSGIIQDMHVNMVANFVVNIFRLHQGYMFIRLDGIDPGKLETVIKEMLGNEYDIKTQIQNGGLAIMVTPKKK